MSCKFFISTNFDYYFSSKLDPAALELWLKIMKPGGVICIVHKSAVWPKWQDQQDKLVASKAWEKVWINEEPVSIVFCVLRNDTGF